MKKLIPILAILFITNVQAQTSYDRKQDKDVANEKLKTITLQTDVNNLKIKTVQQDKDIIQLKLDVADLKKWKDSIIVMIIAFDTANFRVNKIAKDTTLVKWIKSN